MLCSVTWSKVKLSVGQKLTRLTRLGGLMPKDMLFLLRATLDHKNFGKIRSLKNPSTQCPVSIIMTIHVILTKIMKQRGCFIATFVVHVLPRMARSMPTVQWTANRNEQKRVTLCMVNTAQLQPDYVQDQVHNETFSSQYPCRYVYNSSVKQSIVVNEFVAQKYTWQKWFSDSNSFKPVNSSITFADVVKNNVFMSKKDNNTPLVAVQGRSQQHKPPELVKEVSGKTQMAHLTMERKDRFVKKTVVAGSPYDSAPCFNKYAPLADIEDEYCDDSMEIVNQYMVDDDCSWG